MYELKLIVNYQYQSIFKRRVIPYHCPWKSAHPGAALGRSFDYRAVNSGILDESYYFPIHAQTISFYKDIIID